MASGVYRKSCLNKSEEFTFGNRCLAQHDCAKICQLNEKSKVLFKSGELLQCSYPFSNE